LRLWAVFQAKADSDLTQRREEAQSPQRKASRKALLFFALFALLGVFA
jgi:hypothetical protein